jgi:hypothetical protein
MLCVYSTEKHAHEKIAVLSSIKTIRVEVLASTVIILVVTTVLARSASIAAQLAQGHRYHFMRLSLSGVSVDETPHNGDFFIIVATIK